MFMSTPEKEFDTSPIAWQAYRLMYAVNFNENFQVLYQSKPLTLEDLRLMYEVETGPRSRPYITDFTYKGREAREMNFSGETDFNFGKGFGYTRIYKYEKLIENAEISGTDYSRDLLDVCKKLWKSIANISLMPQTGNLQGTKKNIGNDRIDTFIYALNGYYTQTNNLLMNHTSFQNMIYLKSYLDLFDSVEDYCDAIYHINRELVDDLIISGGQAIDSVDRLNEHMELAIRFWGQKIEYLRNQDDRPDEISDAIQDIDSLLKAFPT